MGSSQYWNVISFYTRNWHWNWLSFARSFTFLSFFIPLSFWHIGQLSVCDFMQRLILSFSRGILRRAIEFIMAGTSISSCEKWMWNWQAPSMKVLHLAMKFPSHHLSSSLTILHFLLFLCLSHCLKSFSVCLQRASGIILTNSKLSWSSLISSDLKRNHWQNINVFRIEFIYLFYFFTCHPTIRKLL